MATVLQERHGLAAWHPRVQGPVYASGHGELVRDAAGREYIDMAMGWGACLWGHGTIHERILRTWNADELAQGLGATFTSTLRTRAIEQLVSWLGEYWDVDDELQVGILHTGAEAVEAALKTALAATDRPEVVAFEHAYHGSFGLAAAVSAGSRARTAFDATVHFEHVRHAPYGDVPTLTEKTACVIVEPIQGTPGVFAPPPDFLTGLRTECDRVGALLVLDDVLAGMGRTGVPLEGIECQPDILVLAKALGGGMICSAVASRAAVAERAWGRDDSPSLATTYYGHPFSCAAILEVLSLHYAHDIGELAAKFEPVMRHIEQETRFTARGSGAWWALLGPARNDGIGLARQLQEEGVIATPTGLRSEGIQLLPSLLMTPTSLDRFTDAVIRCAG